MNNFEFDKPRGKFSDVEKHIQDLIEAELGDLFEELDYARCKATHVKTPFILADNGFDIGEANNRRECINAETIEQATFTGGSFYDIIDVIDKSKPSIVVHGNDEEGYNIFILN